jgi:hypothetical protein
MGQPEQLQMLVQLEPLEPLMAAPLSSSLA